MRGRSSSSFDHNTDHEDALISFELDDASSRGSKCSREGRANIDVHFALLGGDGLVRVVEVGAKPCAFIVGKRRKEERALKLFPRNIVTRARCTRCATTSYNQRMPG